MQAIDLSIDHTQVAGDLVDFPVLIELQHSQLKQATQSNICFVLTNDKIPLDHEIESFDPATGYLRAWVCVTHLSGSEDTPLTIQISDSSSDRSIDASQVWRADFRLVVHDLQSRSNSDSTGLNPNLQISSAGDGTAWAQISYSATFEFADALTVEAAIEDPNPRAEALAVAVSQWKSNDEFGSFAAYDAGNTDGLDTTGFFGAVFDGRHVYFVPQHDSETRHGKVLRYDTQRPFQRSESWEAYDAGSTDGLNTKGYYGAVATGRYIYFVPRRDADGFHSRVLRYDTKASFKESSSWQAYDVGLDRSYQSAAFDGRYIYFAPGHVAVHKDELDVVPDCDSPPVTGMDPNYLLMGSSLALRHDTQGEFKDASSWATYDVADTDGLQTSDYDGAVFDGRYIYYCPLSTSAVLRYDTQGAFDNRSSWSAHDVGPLGFKFCVGGVFDGQHVYFVPYGETKNAIRFDTSKSFHEDASWETFDVTHTPGLNTCGFDGALFDGRYVYYIPYYDGGDGFHGVMLRYDPTGPFTDPKSWSCADGGLTDGIKTVSFNGGATDGRYLYFAAWMDGESFPERIIGNGRILRYDTTGNRSTFSLQACGLGHNGGLNAALTGPRFLVNTETGPASANAHALPSAGTRYFAGVFDGQSVKLYVDGKLVNAQPAAGNLVSSSVDLTIGRYLEGLGQCQGKVTEVRLAAAARDPVWITTAWNNISDPKSFLHTS